MPLHSSTNLEFDCQEFMLVVTPSQDLMLLCLDRSSGASLESLLTDLPFTKAVLPEGR